MVLEVDRLRPHIETVFTGKDLLNGEEQSRHIELRDTTLAVYALSRPGKAYSGTRTSEDGSFGITNGTCSQFFVVDGGTQPKAIPGLADRGLTGGAWIKGHVEEDGTKLDPENGVSENLRILNSAIGNDAKANRLTIDYSEHSQTVPYGSIAGVKIDAANKKIEVANAGDCSVLVEYDDHTTQLLTTDDVREHDQRVFALIREVAARHGMTFRQAVQNRANGVFLDEHPECRNDFQRIIDQMYRTMSNGNIGVIRRITGSDIFDVTASQTISSANVLSLFVFSDGATLGFDMAEELDRRTFINIVRESSLIGLHDHIIATAEADPEFEKYNRFGAYDDFMALEVQFS